MTIKALSDKTFKRPGLKDPVTGRFDKDYLLHMQFLNAAANDAPPVKQPLAGWKDHLSAIVRRKPVLKGLFKKAISQIKGRWDVPGMSGAEYERGAFYSMLARASLRHDLQTSEMTVTANLAPYSGEKKHRNPQRRLLEGHGVLLPDTVRGWVGIIAPKNTMETVQDMVNKVADYPVDRNVYGYSGEVGEYSFVSHRGFDPEYAIACQNMPEETQNKLRESGQLRIGYGDIINHYMIFTDRQAFEDAKAFLGLKSSPQAEHNTDAPAGTMPTAG